jgi:hypothetical protein
MLHLLTTAPGTEPKSTAAAMSAIGAQSGRDMLNVSSFGFEPKRL